MTSLSLPSPPVAVEQRQPVLSIWRGMIGAPPPRRETMPQIAARVAAEHGFTVDDLKRRTRTKATDAARLQAYAEIYAAGRNSTLRIGAFFGRDHSSVLHGIRKHQERCG